MLQGLQASVAECKRLIGGIYGEDFLQQALKNAGQPTARCRGLECGDRTEYDASDHAEPRQLDNRK